MDTDYSLDVSDRCKTAHEKTLGYDQMINIKFYNSKWYDQT